MAASSGYTKLRPSSGRPTSFQKPRSCRWRSSRSASVGGIYPRVDAEFGGARYIRLGALDGAISAEQFHARIRPDYAMGLSRKQWLWSTNRAGVGLTSGDAAAEKENQPMRIYIIGHNGITVCGQPPAAVNEGEIVVALNEELHAAELSGKRLLALWNGLPSVEKRRKVGDRGALINELWSAMEMLPDPERQSEAKRTSKQDQVIAMLCRPEGVTVDEVTSATGWQRHTVRGVFSGTLKKKLGLTLASAQEERGRVYRITEGRA